MSLLLLLVALLAVGSSASGLKCPNGAVASMNSDKCFHVVPLKATFQVAQTVCQNFGGNLASVHNKYDNAYLGELANSSFWIGGSDLSNNDTWKWLDGTPLTYANWAAGGPSHNYDLDCLLVDMTTGLWAATKCITQAHFVCETAIERSQTPPSCPTQRPCTCQACICSTPQPLLTTPKTPKPCPSGYTCTKSKGYTMYDQPVSWLVANEICQQAGGDLASIHSDEEQSIVVYVLDVANAWIGGEVQQRIGSWSDGSPFDYAKWQNRNFPVNYAGTTCVRIQNDGTWVNLNCGAVLPFVCEVSLI